ncbi:MAG: TetR/AcrR family transcriptional regulator [Acidimicrobiales bacterium]|nr:TetR/AcrR family transcriptional regulator [Acidimicrobiales bacterium]
MAPTRTQVTNASIPHSGDETRDRMLESALLLFGENGIANTTMEQVAERAGISRVWLYRRFKNKAGLVQEVVDRELDNYFVALDEVLAPMANGTEVIVEAFCASVMFLRNHSLLSSLLETEPETLLPILTIDSAPLMSHAVGIMTPWLVERGSIDKNRAPFLAEAVIRLLTSIVLVPSHALNFDDPKTIRKFLKTSMGW